MAVEEIGKVRDPSMSAAQPMVYRRIDVAKQCTSLECILVAVVNTISNPAQLQQRLQVERG